MLQSLIQKQLQTDFPDQAADLHALQDVSSSVSTNSGLLRQGVRTAPPVMSSKPLPPKIELPEWMQIGKAMLPVLQKLMFGNWDRIDESHELGDGRKVTIAGYGHENKASRTITIEDINGQTMVLTGEQILGSDDGNQTPLLALTGGTVNGRNLSENELQSFSEALTFAGVRTVLNSDVNEDGEEGERPLPGIGDNSIPSGIEPIDEEQPTEDYATDIPAENSDTTENDSDADAPPEQIDHEWGEADQDHVKAVDKQFRHYSPETIDGEITSPFGKLPVPPPKGPKIYLGIFGGLTKGAQRLHRIAGKVGKESGIPDPFDPGMNKEQEYQRASERTSGTILSRLGFNVKHQPRVRASDNLGPDKTPDFRIEGKIYDNYMPIDATTPAGIVRGMRTKIKDKQTYRLVVDLTRNPISVRDVLIQLQKSPINDLLDVIFIK